MELRLCAWSDDRHFLTGGVGVGARWRDGRVTTDPARPAKGEEGQGPQLAREGRIMASGRIAQPRINPDRYCSL